jgi:hypothetical protein
LPALQQAELRRAALLVLAQLVVALREASELSQLAAPRAAARAPAVARQAGG